MCLVNHDLAGFEPTGTSCISFGDFDENHLDPSAIWRMNIQL